MKRFAVIFVILVMMFTIPANAATDLVLLNLGSPRYVLLDKDSGTVIFESNAHEQIKPASLTKIMTLIVAIENLATTDLMNTRYTLPAAIFSGIPAAASVANFKAGDTLTLYDILMGINLPSGADATRAISYYLTGESEGLVALMNQKAAELNMTNTHFVNTSGLDHDDQYSTVYDIALLLDYALENPIFTRIYSTESYTSSATPNYRNGIRWVNQSLQSLHQENNDFVIGAKSGYTTQAKLALSSYTQVNSMNLILVTHGAEPGTTYTGHINDHSTILNYVIENYTRAKILDRNQFLGTIAVIDGISDYTLRAKEDVYVIVPKNIDNSKLSIHIEFSDKLVAPVVKNVMVASVWISYNDIELYNDDYYSDITIQKVSNEIQTKEQDAIQFVVSNRFVSLSKAGVSLMILAIGAYFIAEILHKRTIKN